VKLEREVRKEKDQGVTLGGSECGCGLVRRFSCKEKKTEQYKEGGQVGVAETIQKRAEKRTTWKWADTRMVESKQRKGLGLQRNHGERHDMEDYSNAWGRT